MEEEGVNDVMAEEPVLEEVLILNIQLHHI